jgi:hypothetical protein
MEPTPFDWSALNSIARWVLDGPRSIVSTSEPGGGPAGWIEKYAHWCVQPTVGPVESWTVYLRPNYEGMSLPRCILRVATWDKHRDRDERRTGLMKSMSLRVEHFECSDTIVDIVHAREKELAKCLARIADKPPANSADPEISTAAYRWLVPGRYITHRLFWLSTAQTAALDQLWRETLPKMDGLRRLTGLIERFESDSFGSCVDASLDQIPTIHQLI